MKLHQKFNKYFTEKKIILVNLKTEDFKINLFI